MIFPTQRLILLAPLVITTGCLSYSTSPDDIPAVVDAEVELHSALEQAKQQDKVVFVHLTGPG